MSRDWEPSPEEAEMLRDVHAYDEAKRAIAEGEELVPSEVTYAILDGENPIRVWREYRGLTQQQLADAAGISVPYLSQIESGKRTGSTRVLAAIAKALGGLAGRCCRVMTTSLNAP